MSNTRDPDLLTLIELARRQGPDGLWIHDRDTGAVIATLIAHRLPTRPKDMPRHLRPKKKLSKRQRDRTKRARLGELAGV
jgi:hypothetical protein